MSAGADRWSVCQAEVWGWRSVRMNDVGGRDFAARCSLRESESDVESRHVQSLQCSLDNPLDRRNRSSCTTTKVHNGDLFPIPNPAQHLLQDTPSENCRRSMLQRPDPVCPCEREHVLDRTPDGWRGVGLFMELDETWSCVGIHGGVWWRIDRCQSEDSFMPVNCYL